MLIVTDILIRDSAKEIILYASSLCPNNAIDLRKVESCVEVHEWWRKMSFEKHFRISFKVSFPSVYICDILKLNRSSGHKR